MSQSEKVVRTIIDLANRHEVSAIQEHLADDMTFVNPVSGSTDKRGMELFHTGFFGGFPDAHYRIDRLTSQGDAVVVECTVLGTNLGEFAGAAPTRNKISVPAAFCIDVHGPGEKLADLPGCGGNDASTSDSRGSYDRWISMRTARPNSGGALLQRLLADVGVAGMKSEPAHDPAAASAEWLRHGCGVNKTGLVTRRSVRIRG